MSIVCTICARGGSKGVPGKNFKLINGKPLIAYTIEQALKSKLFDQIAVSSDSKEVLDISKSLGVIAINRPDELATDKSAKIPAIRHCVSEVEKQTNMRFDICVDLDCTSPLREISDIIECVDLLKQNDCSNVITAAPSRRSPYFNLVEVDKNNKVKLSKKLDTNIVRRQDAPATYDMNASIYVWKRNALFESDTVFFDDTKLFVMPEERSVDIDSPLDLKIVELMLKEKEK